jgi:hypothetical protein
MGLHGLLSLLSKKICEPRLLTIYGPPRPITGIHMGARTSHNLWASTAYFRDDFALTFTVTSGTRDLVATCPQMFPQEIDPVPWDEVGHKTRYKRIENAEGIEFGD